MSNVLRSSLLNVAATTISLVTGFAVSVIVARLLGPSGSGMVAFVVWAAMAASAIADRGMPQTVLRYVSAAGPDGNERQTIIDAAFTRFLLAVTVVFCLAVLLGLFEVYWRSPEDSVIYFVGAALFLLYALNAFSTAASRGKGGFAETAGCIAIGGLIQIPLAFLGAMYFGVAGAIAGMATRYLPQSLLLRRHVSRRRDTPAYLKPDMGAYGRHIWLGDLIDVVAVSRIEFLVLGYFLTTEDVGFFAAAIVFAGLVIQMAHQISPAFVVGFSSALATPGAPERLYGESFRVMTLCALPIGFGGGAIIPALLPLVFGEAFAPASPAAALLLIVSALAALAVVPWSYLAAREKGRSLMQLSLLNAALTVICLLVVVPVFGVIGAAIVRCIAEIASFGLLVRTVRSVGGPPLPAAALVRTAAAAGACGVAAVTIVSLVAGAAGIMLGIAGGALVYLAGIRVLGLVDRAAADLLLDASRTRLPSALHRFVELFVNVIARPATTR
ncbi:oligosaccharide flippase family protein [Rhizobium sp. TRM95111]|uniref:lipopolysaccharide biosynthesis protein n=1 Tax=Rhizobium alarense TaxID=2846851 RepID=UPI001F403772|nr:oligosaccharide flippase family protein [Rhizobium alarense]MCF3639664.1 oligosaccharide flippase family protein [Rhizobium alarense]